MNDTLKKYIFAYGSLMCPESCKRTLKRTVSYTPAILTGYERKFNAFGSVYHHERKEEVCVRFANLIENNQAKCLGLVFEISDFDLNELIVREKFYDVVDVSNSIEFIDFNSGQVLTFISKKVEQNNNSFILEKYINLMLCAGKPFPSLIEQLEKEYLSINPKEILNGSYLSITGLY